MEVLGIGSILYTCYQGIKEAFEPVVLAENWANKELYHRDMMNGVPIEKRMKYLEQGRYRLTKNHPEPHRDPKTGKIVIENCKLHDQDLRNYGVYMVYKWAEEGRYNLTPEELEKERERIHNEFEHLYQLKRCSRK